MLGGGLLVLQGQSVGAVVDGKCVILPGQHRLNEGENDDGKHQHQQEHGDLVLAEGVERGAPIGIVAGAGLLGLLLVEGSKGEKLLIAQVALELLVQAGFQRVYLRMLQNGHQRSPPFLVRLIRGSNSAIIRSPSKRPMMPTVAYSSTIPSTMALSCFFTTSTSRPPMPGMEYRDSI